MTHAWEEWYLDERPRALAVVLLTERDDLEITSAREPGLRFLVKLQRPEVRSPRQFGVALDARVEPAGPAEVNKILSARVRAQSAGVRYPYPVCLFYFTLKDNGAYYAWVVEPQLTGDGQPSLVACPEAECAALDRAALDAIVDAVDAWYAASDAARPAGVG